MSDDEQYGALKEANHLHYNSVDYKLDEWLTTTAYAQKHKLKTPSVVNNWIKRGRVPKDNLVIIPELSDLVLIKDTEYPPIKKGITKFNNL